MKRGYLILIALVVLASLVAVGCKSSANAAVPASWDGDFALKVTPDAGKVLTIHDGKIFTVAADSETEIFPATYAKSGYKVKCSDTEVKAEYSSSYVKFSLVGENLTMETTGGTKVEYIKIKK